LRRRRHIDEAVCRLMERPEADAVRTVCIPFQNPFKMWRIQADGFMHPLIPSVEGAHREPYNLPRQALPEVYWQTGYVDAAWADTILTKDSMTGERILPLVIDPSEWIDIDSPDDWRRAERLLESGEITLEEFGFNIEIRE
jgi:N-acylneuraminate cytidylyltransferase